jgi:phage regulator Rha-like protein
VKHFEALAVKNHLPALKIVTIFYIMENEPLPIQNMIHEIRGHKVMLDSDLARLYEVEVKALNQAVKRNADRFPDDFMFQLTKEEWDILRSQFVTANKYTSKIRYLPYVFTEQGVAMLATVLNSQKAIDVNIQIMRTFVKLRHYTLSLNGTSEQITELRKLLMLHIENNDYKFSEHDKAIRQIMQALNNLIEKPKEPKKIGFGT